MSFILDALKKSESDRQQRAEPENAYVASGYPADTPNRWLWVIGGLLAVNALVLLVFFFRPSPPAPESDLATAPQNVATTDQSITFRERVDEARRGQPTTTPDSVSEVDMPVAPVAKPATASNVVPPASTPSTTTTAYPTLNEVLADGSIQLPELHLDIHVYSETPAERFVFVNMSKYAENATLSEGPVVTEIVPEGVVLEFSGTQFLLPRE